MSKFTKTGVQIIDDFAAYNGEGFMSTLELLPMWQDVDPDVDLFGSGVISELSPDASEWEAGHPLSLDGPSAFEFSQCDVGTCSMAFTNV
jgi:hypothetical protein